VEFSEAVRLLLAGGERQRLVERAFPEFDRAPDAAASEFRHCASGSLVRSDTGRTISTAPPAPGVPCRLSSPLAKRPTQESRNEVTRRNGDGDHRFAIPTDAPGPGAGVIL
jgi:hypothetical protein